MTEAMRRVATSVALLLVTAIGVVSCASPSSRIATGLSEYGLSEGAARCMGDRLQSRLSLGQLQQLGRAARALGQNDTTPGRLTAADLVRASGQVQDVKIPLEVTKAAAGCGALREAVGVQGE
jgi:hypothetical protein